MFLYYDLTKTPGNEGSFVRLARLSRFSWFSRFSRFIPVG